ncbi:hypothetical protein SARC_06613 [Sphaeroforma arctica JP610]|uniref:Peptidase S1 domain-containing protein n=1 Tax=Sphaeroforma arctica JP610 TaxID=667725 RepID=A0A0L0FYL5_9EUKA|nr:hypothetical protein SARC_06613 [Sphaeroforma arctica JP610]KNC81053.1 hypothetical protein SARC_06613 [Sphaeroforma arctica JP610]|eukprot:XP_014154955.1 hypothetical protein SARC_06613 [Sphaeroforma arctica JP610]
MNGNLPGVPRQQFERYLDSVVKIFAVTVSPNYIQPWSVKPQRESTGSGFVIEVNQAMVSLVNQAMINLVNQAMVNLVNQALVSLVNQAMVSLVNQAMVSLIDQAIVNLVNQAMVSLVNQAMVNLVNQAMVNLVNQAMVNLVNQAMVSLVNQAMVSLVNQAMVNLVNQAMVNLVNQAMGNQVNQAMVNLVNQAIVNLVNQAMCQRLAMARMAYASLKLGQWVIAIVCVYKKKVVSSATDLGQHCNRLQLIVHANQQDQMYPPMDFSVAKSAGNQGLSKRSKVLRIQDSPKGPPTTPTGIHIFSSTVLCRRILTNAHVIANGTSIMVRKHGSPKKFPAKCEHTGMFP